MDAYDTLHTTERYLGFWDCAIASQGTNESMTKHTQPLAKALGLKTKKTGADLAAVASKVGKA